MGFPSPIWQGLEGRGPDEEVKETDYTDHICLGGGFKQFFFLPRNHGEMIQFDYSIFFHMGSNFKPPSSIS